MRPEYPLHLHWLVLRAVPRHKWHERGGATLSRSAYGDDMLKDYIYCGRRFQFDEQDVPEGAVLASEAAKAKTFEAPKNKEVAPTNKAKKVAKK